MPNLMSLEKNTEAFFINSQYVKFLSKHTENRNNPKTNLFAGDSYYLNYNSKFS